MSKRSRDNEQKVGQPPTKKLRISINENDTKQNNKQNNIDITSSSTSSIPSDQNKTNNNPNNSVTILDKFPDSIQDLISEFAAIDYENISFIPIKSASIGSNKDFGKISFNITNIDYPGSLGIYHLRYDASWKIMETLPNNFEEFNENLFEESNQYYHKDKNQFIQQSLIKLISYIFKYENGNFSAVGICSLFLEHFEINSVCFPYPPYIVNRIHYFLKPATKPPLFDIKRIEQYQYQCTILVKDKGGFICNSKHYGNTMQFERKCLIFQNNDGIQIYLDFPITFMVRRCCNDICFKLRIENSNITGDKFYFSTKEWSDNDWRFRMEKYFEFDDDIPDYHIDTDCIAMSYNYLKTRKAYSIDPNAYSYGDFERNVKNSGLEIIHNNVDDIM